MLRKTPLFRYHGTLDPILPFKNSNTTFKFLEENVYNGEFSRNYIFHPEKGLGHKISKKSSNMVKSWLTEKFDKIEITELSKPQIVD